MTRLGLLLLDVEVRDVQAADPKMRKALQDKSIKLAEAAATLAEARGEAAALRTTADAEAYAIQKVRTEITQPGGDRKFMADLLRDIAPKIGALNISQIGGAEDANAVLPLLLARLAGINPLPPTAPPPQPAAPPAGQRPAAQPPAPDPAGQDPAAADDEEEEPPSQP